MTNQQKKTCTKTQKTSVRNNNCAMKRFNFRQKRVEKVDFDMNVCAVWGRNDDLDQVFRGKGGIFFGGGRFNQGGDLVAISPSQITVPPIKWLPLGDQANPTFFGHEPFRLLSSQRELLPLFPRKKNEGKPQNPAPAPAKPKQKPKEKAPPYHCATVASDLGEGL